ncbi:holo-ACP synthase [Hydrogenovibrio sp. 3SP14C1]|uniref:holo-ACP synthase n=1 Tax=Hydrogenovibrio sp. 3SP14C1 TaxID=3038774 RepID=UPI002416F479|nr:holo-ACP synthase [Hydrogenovibrio sp. 3SP14C1]MDG4813092.1 holo-ACP synthase [Hydrogenovibrio sp. 3SP14C1]
MIVGIGTDLVEIARISALMAKRKEAFIKRILAPQELKRFEKHAQPEKFLAKRWAAKEAISKALGTGFTQGVCFTDMIIGHTNHGQPLIELTGKTAEIAQQLGIDHWSISISDEVHYAIAFVIAEKSV